MAKVHLIGNAHLDPAWLWNWQEGCSEVLATFRSALLRMREDEGYLFTCAGARYYEWVEQLDPAMFREIRQRVEEGRWVIVGGWYIQPDCNAPGAESFARHALYSQQYYLKAFGRTAKIGYNVDSFGHSAALPQLLRLGGLEAYVYMRPNRVNEMRYPFPEHAFLWQGADGTRIPTYQIDSSYASGPFGQAAEKAREALRLSQEEQLPQMAFYGVGNHGGGPTKENLAALRALMAASPEGEYAFSSPDGYFGALETSDLPVWKGELQHHASGCYTALIEIKRACRLAEVRLIDAERYASLATMLGYPTDLTALKEIWKTLLFQQFHDILGGCCIRSACDEALRALGGCAARAAEIENQALQALAWNTDTSAAPTAGVPLHLFNARSYPLRVPVRAGVNAALVTDDSGQPIPSQHLRGQVTNGKADKWEACFVAELPAFGWRTYWLQCEQPQGERDMSAKPRTLRSEANILENDWLLAEFDRQTGLPGRLLRKEDGVALLAAPASFLTIDETDSDTWAHNLFRFDKVVDRFQCESIDAWEAGDVQASVRTTLHCGACEMSIVWTMYREIEGLYADCTLIWRGTHRMLKLSLPTPFAGAQETAAIAGGFLRREADGLEQPVQGWLSLQGLGLAGDALAAYDCLNGEIRATTLRSPLYADHYGERDAFCEPSEQGEHRFRFVLTGNTSPTSLQRLTESLWTAPGRILGSGHEGGLPLAYSGSSVKPDSVEMDVCKPAEDGNGWIVRLRETTGAARTATVDLHPIGHSLQATLRPLEIRVYRLANGTTEATDFTER